MHSFVDIFNMKISPKIVNIMLFIRLFHNAVLSAEFTYS